MADILDLSEEGKKYTHTGRCPNCHSKVRLYKSDFVYDGSQAKCPVCGSYITKDFIVPTREYDNLLLFADFNVEDVIKAFAKTSQERGGKAIDDWDYIILAGVGLENHGKTIEEEIVRLIWKGIDAQTKEYLDYVDESL